MFGVPLTVGEMLRAPAQWQESLESCCWSDAETWFQARGHARDLTWTTDITPV